MAVMSRHLNFSRAFSLSFQSWMIQNPQKISYFSSDNQPERKLKTLVDISLVDSFLLTHQVLDGVLGSVGGHGVERGEEVRHHLDQIEMRSGVT